MKIMTPKDLAVLDELPIRDTSHQNNYGGFDWDVAYGNTARYPINQTLCHWMEDKTSLRSKLSQASITT